jgi:hypothetical protein
MSNGALRGLLHRGMKMLRAKLEHIDCEHTGGSV